MLRNKKAVRLGAVPLALFATTVMLSACTTDKTSTTTESESVAVAEAEDTAVMEEIEGMPTGSWSLESGENDGKTITIVNPITMIVGEDGEVSGDSGCNSYRTTMDVEKVSDAETVVLFSAIASTKMACDETAMQSETQFFESLEKAEMVKQDGSVLEFTGKDMKITFVKEIAQSE